MNNWLSGGKTSVTDEDRKQIAQSKAKAAEKRREHLPWIEKYRPKKVADVAFQDEVVAVLHKVVNGADLPNMLFYGPPGTGKTSAILAVARELFGGEYYRSRVLELNASDERGIAVVRDKVKSFASSTVPAHLPNGKACPPIKLIILDEADNMTTTAQAALRRTMEKLSKYTRFCLICNYISRIIDPITSRCAKFRFKPLDATAQILKLREIATSENVNIGDEELGQLQRASEGDLRKSVMFLQAAYRLAGSSETLKVDDSILEPLTGIIPDEIMQKCFRCVSSGSFNDVKKFVDDFMRQGYPAQQLITQIHDHCLNDRRLQDEQKTRIFHRIGICDVRLNDGADEYLELLDLACVMMKQYGNAAAANIDTDDNAENME